jgi:hypothetical protein
LSHSLADFDKFKYKSSSIKGQTKHDQKMLAHLSESEIDRSPLSDKRPVIKSERVLENKLTLPRVDSVECPSCSDPVPIVEGADFIFCGKRQCSVEAARMYTTEVKTRDDKIKSLTVALQEAQDRIAELESIISHE